MRKVFVYNYREFDEKDAIEEAAAELGFEWDATSEYPTEENLRALEGKGYDQLSIITCPMTRERIEYLASIGIKSIGTRSVGYEHIDVAACHEFGIKVSHAIYPPNTVASYTVMMTLMLLRNWNELQRRTDLQDFTLKGKLGKEISDCTIGIIGTGEIGAAVAKRLHGFDCKIVAYARHENPAISDFVEYLPLDEVLAVSDVITLHIPGNEANFHLLNEEKIGLMKEGAFLVNTARGEVVDTAALIQALQSGKLGGAALDVVERDMELYYKNLSGKDMRKDLGRADYETLKSMPNVILSPHIAFYTDQATRAMAKTSLAETYLI